MAYPEQLASSEDAESGEEALAAKILSEWASEHTTETLKLLPYDPQKYPHQRLDVVHIPAVTTPETLEMAAYLARQAMGSDNYDKIVEGFENTGAKYEILARAKHQKSTLVATGHMPETFDTALTHSLLMAAVGDPLFAEHNVVLGNHIQKFMQIAGYPVTEILSWSGDVILGMPAKGALAHGIPRDIVRQDIRRVGEETDKAIARGIAFHRAPTGTRAKDIILSNGRPAKMLPQLDPRWHKWLIENTNRAVRVPLNYKEGDARGAVYAPVNFLTPDDIEYFMKDLADELSDYSEVPVVYGLPEGASIVD